MCCSATPLGPRSPAAPTWWLPLLPLPLTPQNQLPDLNNTSISVIINPALGLPILKDLFAKAQTTPHTVWLQPGAESAEIEAFIKEHGLEDKFVIGGPCILVHGDAAREGKANL